MKTIRGGQAALFVLETLAAVLVPCTLAALGGNWLDEMLKITPIMTLVGFVVAVILSFLLMRRQAKQYRAMI